MSLGKVNFSSNDQKRSQIRANMQSPLKQAGRSMLQIQRKLPEPDETPYITARSWCIFDAQNGKFQKGISQNEIREMASLTKMATLITALRLIKRLNIDPLMLYFSVSEKAANIQGTSARLEENEWILINDLLYGLMLPSGNDAAITLAENFGCLLYFESIGQQKIFSEIHSVDVTEDAYVNDYYNMFVKEMNKVSEEFNLKSTKFSNPHGLSNRQNYSSANDLAKLTYFCLKNEDFRKIVSKRNYKAITKYVQFDNEVIERNIHWENTNKLLDRGFRGVKTGITASAGACLSSWFVKPTQSKQQDEIDSIIIVVLGSSDPEKRFEDTQKLVDWYFNKPLIQPSYLGRQEDNDYQQYSNF